MSDRIAQFLAAEPHDGPCLVVDLNAVAERFAEFRAALPDTAIFYAVKANPAPALLATLARLGSSFDCASVQEIRLALAAGATVDRIAFGNTIKRATDIAAAYALGIRLFAFDCWAELEKIATHAPGAGVLCRLLTAPTGADWPLSRKFGCAPARAADLLQVAPTLGLVPLGVSFHVGSQQRNPGAFDVALADAAAVFRACDATGVSLRIVNLGGGFPARVGAAVPRTEAYAQAITDGLRRHFGNRLPQTMIEPGRGMVADAGIIRSEVVLVAENRATDGRVWVYLDIGKFGGLIETTDEAIRYPITSDRDGGVTRPCVLAGPTCDSADILYERDGVELPAALMAGDHVLIHGTGAYTSSYSAVNFNGFPPLRTVCL